MRRKSRLARRLESESLETRQVLAASMTAGVLTVTGTPNIDTIELFGRGSGIVEVIAPGVAPLTRFTGVTSVRVDGLAEKDAIKFENVSAPVTAIGGDGDDRIQYLAEGSGAVNVDIDGGAGIDEIEVDLKLSPQASQTSNVVVNSGLGDDKTRIQVTSDVVDLVFSGNVTDAGGNDELFFQLDQKSQIVGSRVGATLTANVGSGLDKLLAKVESESQTSNFQMNVTGSDGTKEINSEVMLEGGSSNARVGYNIATGNDLDKIDLKTISQALSTLVQDQTVSTAGGNDLVKIGIDQIRPAAATVNSSINLGDGNDEFEMGFSGDSSSLRLNGTINGGLGDDKMLVKVKSLSLFNNLSLLGGGGNDLIDFLQ